jgi:hypothetical protein
MVVVRVIFTLEAPCEDGLFGVAQSLFPFKEGQNWRLESLGANGELKTCVYFPLPYKSAERFPEDERYSFIAKMALFTISTAVLPNLFDGNGRQELAESVPDPRDPSEIEREKRWSKLKSGLSSLLSWRNEKPKRSFNEYL